jgi:hypothetical protein
MHRGLLIGIITLYILAQLICNAVEDQAMLTSTNISDVQDMMSHSTTVSTDALGQIVSSITGVFSTIGTWINKYILFDYTIFKDYDPVTGTTTANQLAIFRFLLIGMGFAVLVDFYRVLRGN